MDNATLNQHILDVFNETDSPPGMIFSFQNREANAELALAQWEVSPTMAIHTDGRAYMVVDLNTAPWAGWWQTGTEDIQALLGDISVFCTHCIERSACVDHDAGHAE